MEYEQTRLGGHRDGVPGRGDVLREIASQHGISEGAIRKRAKRDDWSRDLAAKVKERADDLVRKAEVRKQVRSEATLNERVLIEATAEVIASVRMEHRGDIKRARQITNALFDEPGAECADVAALEKLGELMFDPDDKGQDKLMRFTTRSSACRSALNR